MGIIRLCILACLLFLLPTLANADQQISADFEHDWFVASKVKLNGKPAKMVIDTGSPRTIIFNPEKLSLVLMDGAEKQQARFIDASSAQLVKAQADISINDTSIGSTEILTIVDEASWSPSLKRTTGLVDGVLGLDVLGVSNTHISREGVVKKGMERPLRPKPEVSVDLKIGHLEFECLIDTGLKRGEHVILRLRNQDHREQILNLATASIVRPSRSESGENASFFKVPVEFAGTKKIVTVLLEPVAVARLLPSGIGKCALGPQWLLSHDILLTAEGPELVAVRPIEFFYNFTGISSISPTEDGRALEIIEVEQRSPAERAGLRRGDFIISIDGKSSFLLTPAEIQSFMRTPPKELSSLQVTRSGQTINVSLIAEDYLR